MTPSEEAAYETGRREALMSMMRRAAAEYEARDEVDFREWTRLRAEVDAAHRALRGIVMELGLEVDWPGDLHLADVIEKRFGRALLRARSDR